MVCAGLPDSDLYVLPDVPSFILRLWKESTKFLEFKNFSALLNESASVVGIGSSCVTNLDCALRPPGLQVSGRFTFGLAVPGR